MSRFCRRFLRCDFLRRPYQGRENHQTNRFALVIQGHFQHHALQRLLQPNHLIPQA